MVAIRTVSKAYLRAADSVAMLTEPIGEMIGEMCSAKYQELAIAAVMTTLFETGSHPSLKKENRRSRQRSRNVDNPRLRPEKALKSH